VQRLAAVKFHSFVFVLAVCTLAGQAQAQTVDCSRRTAEDYVPTTRQDRLGEYVRSLVYPEAFLYAGTVAGVWQAADRPTETGQGAGAYGRRFGNAYAYNAISMTLQDGIALGLAEDNRYFASGRHGFGPRLKFALVSPFLAWHGDGSRRVSISALTGVAAGTAIQEIWLPASAQNAWYAAASFGLTFAFRMGLDVVREFAPRPVAHIVR
jgi:hypothetical protein